MSEGKYNKGGDESLVWLRNKDGKKYAAQLRPLTGSHETGITA